MEALGADQRDGIGAGRPRQWASRRVVVRSRVERRCCRQCLRGSTAAWRRSVGDRGHSVGVNTVVCVVGGCAMVSDTSFRVLARNSVGLSSPSAVVSAVPGATTTFVTTMTVSEPMSAVDETAAGVDEVPGSAGPAESYTLGDLVWMDVDGDGVQDNGEPSAARVEVVLVDRRVVWCSGNQHRSSRWS